MYSLNFIIHYNTTYILWIYKMTSVWQVITKVTLYGEELKQKLLKRCITSLLACMIMPLVMQLCLVMISKYSKFCIDIFRNILSTGLYKVSAQQQQEQWWSINHSSLTLLKWTSLFTKVFQLICIIDSQFPSHHSWKEPVLDSFPPCQTKEVTRLEVSNTNHANIEADKCTS